MPTASSCCPAASTSSSISSSRSAPSAPADDMASGTVAAATGRHHDGRRAGGRPRRRAPARGGQRLRGLGGAAARASPTAAHQTRRWPACCWSSTAATGSTIEAALRRASLAARQRAAAGHRARHRRPGWRTCWRGGVGGDHAALRPATAEGAAARACSATWARLAGATGARSCPLAVRRGRPDALGPALTGSTSLAHLCLPAAAARRAAGAAAPGRGRGRRLWAALADGRLQGVASDHRPPSLRRQPDVAPHVGIAAAALRLPLLHADGVVAGRIDLPRLAALTAEAARPPPRAVAAQGLARAVAPTPTSCCSTRPPAGRSSLGRVEGRGRAPAWDGRELAGGVQSVLARGDWVVRDGTVLFRPGRGRPVTAGPGTG